MAGLQRQNQLKINSYKELFKLLFIHYSKLLKEESREKSNSVDIIPF